MCGIAGAFATGTVDVRSDEVATMVDSLRHRGPDDRDVWAAPRCALGHARLAILDPTSHAAQPMTSSDDRFVLTFNGEIYNYRQLRLQLPGAVRLRSTGDTEVLLEHLAHHGTAQTLSRLEGDFAFALYDRERHELVLARDRLGVKPLYYSVDTDGRVRFASETKAFLTATARPDLTSVTAMLLGAPGTWGEATLLEGVRTVQPGEWLVFVRGTAAPRRSSYASPAQLVDPGLAARLEQADEDTVVRMVAEALDDSLQARSVSDAPLACLLSGGVDSALVTALAARRTKGLTVYHADVTSDSERLLAADLAGRMGLTLRVAPFSDRDFVDTISSVTWHNDLPLTYHPNAAPLFGVCRLAHQDGVKVLLTGEGSDEFFLGYAPTALAPVLDLVALGRRRLQGMFHRLTGRLGRLLWPRDAERPSELAQLLQSRYQDHIVMNDSESALSFVEPLQQRRAQAMSLRLSQSHLASLLHRNDRLGLAWSVEARFPFLGTALTRLAVNLPLRYKLRRTLRAHDPRHPFVIDKWVVRAVAARLLPRSVALRPKRGFPVSAAARVRVRPGYFDDGFVADAFGLSSAACRELEAGSPPFWLTRLMLVDVWGRLFFDGLSPEQVQRRLDRDLRIEAPPTRGNAAPTRRAA